MPPTQGHSRSYRPRVTMPPTQGHADVPDPMPPTQNDPTDPRTILPTQDHDAPDPGACRCPQPRCPPMPPTELRVLKRAGSGLALGLGGSNPNSAPDPGSCKSLVRVHAP